MADPTLKYASIYWASENVYSEVKWLEYRVKIQMTSEDDFHNLGMRNFEEKNQSNVAKCQKEPTTKKLQFRC